jgi:hypothetical protein
MAGTVRSSEGEADVDEQPSTPLARKATVKVTHRPNAVQPIGDFAAAKLMFKLSN